MELQLNINDSTARKIQALAKLKNVDANFIGSMLEDNIDGIITSAIVEELGLESTPSALSIENNNTETTFNDLETEDSWVNDDDNLPPAPVITTPFQHSLSDEDEGEVDTTPNPLLEVEAQENQPPPSEVQSLVDENIANANVTDDQEAYLEEMVDLGSAQEAAPVQATSMMNNANVGIPLQKQPTPASSFKKGRVSVSEVGYGGA